MGYFVKYVVTSIVDIAVFKYVVTPTPTPHSKRMMDNHSGCRSDEICRHVHNNLTIKTRGGCNQNHLDHKTRILNQMCFLRGTAA